MAINLDVALLNLLGIVVGSIIVSPILWLVGKAFVEPENAKFSDAFWIIFLGNVIGGIFNVVFSAFFYGFSASIIGFIIQLFIWIGLVKHFFDTTGFKALAIAIVALIVTIIIFAILAAILLYFGLLPEWIWI
jgi:pilus assembly protein TadC